MSLAGSTRALDEISSWPGYAPTPLHSLSGLARQLGLAALWYKDESQRFGVGSFKAIGGGYAVCEILKTEVQRHCGRPVTSSDLRSGAYESITRSIVLTTATAGNHGRAVAWAAQMFKCRCVVYVPADCSVLRAAAIAAYGADVVRTSLGYDDTVKECLRRATERGHFIVSDTSWNGYEQIPCTVMQGYTVITSEVTNQLPQSEIPTHIFVQGGVGSFAAAVAWHVGAHWAESNPQLIVVEPEHAACLMESARAGKPTALKGPSRSIMGGLATAEISPYAWPFVRDATNIFVSISDAAVSPTIRMLAFPVADDPAIVGGESGVAGLAALIGALGDETEVTNALSLGSDSRVLLFGTEGATDPLIYEQLRGPP
jgi:diaminopropionate ammonia-lyase